MVLNSTQVPTHTEEFTPRFFRLTNPSEKFDFRELLASDPTIAVYDEMEGQLRELIKSLNPAVKIKLEDYPSLILEHLKGRELDEYGVWVYYSWTKRMVHLLDEVEFVEVRTNRNRYKITREEQEILRQKKIGIVGLSVGQSIALTIATERICGEIRLADFDTVELSNLNRIRTGLHNLGQKKTVIAAREISEIDPFLRVRVFNDGLHKHNIDRFFSEDGPLDLLVEVCDGLDVKILSRFKARSLKVPVVMDTNDRGMLDVERYDLEPERPILHGLAGDLDPQKISDLTNEQKIPYILKMIGAESISTRLKASMLEVEQSINTWPQLASSVTLGGAITTDVCRNIFLDRFHDSGRYYIDLDEIIKDQQPKTTVRSHDFSAPPVLTIDDLEQIARKHQTHENDKLLDLHALTKDRLDKILEAACLAPSGGNAQPWKFLYRGKHLYIFHDAHYSHSLLNFKNLGSYIAFGAMVENIELKAAALDLSVQLEIFPLGDDLRLIAVAGFEKKKQENPFIYLNGVIGERMTYRNISQRKLLKEEDKKALIGVAASVAGARLQLFESADQLLEFAEMLTNTERLRFLHPRGHFDTFVNELRFTKEEVESTADGLDIQTLNVSQSDIAALQIARDPQAIAFLHQLQKGSGFKKMSRKNVLAASAIGVVSMNGHDAIHFLEGGRAVERIWLEANHRHLAFQPIAQIVFMTEKLISGAAEFNAYEQAELWNIKNKFSTLTGLDNNRYPVFVFRLCYADEPAVRSLRRPLQEVFFIDRQQGRQKRASVSKLLTAERK